MNLRNVNVNVTKRSIREGIAGSCKNCMMALSIKKLLKKGYQAWVDGTTFDIAKVDSKGIFIEYVAQDLPLGPIVKHAIKKYDGSPGTMKPFCAYVELPVEALK